MNNAPRNEPSGIKLKRANQNPTTLYFIRHGQTPSNKQHIHQGIQIDDYLDGQGVLQIEKISEFISLLNLDILFTSYLHRAEETAVLIGAHLPKAIPIIHDSRLRERDFGSLTGKSQEEFIKLVPDGDEKEQMQTYDYRPFGGENVADVRKRAIGAILDIAQNYRDKNIGIVTHDGIIRLLLFHFPEIPRVYRDHQDLGKDVANADIYEWEVTEEIIENLRSLLG